MAATNVCIIYITATRLLSRVVVPDRDSQVVLSGGPCTALGNESVSLMPMATWLSNPTMAAAQAWIGALPAKIAGYWFRADGAGGVPTIPQVSSNTTNINYLDHFVAQGAGPPSNGSLVFPQNPVAADIATFKATGGWMSLTLGGSSANVGAGGELLCNTTTQRTNMLASIASAVSTYGFQGIAWDMENDTGQYNVSIVAGMFATLKSTYGSSFSISLNPAPYQIRDLTTYPMGQLYASASADIDLIAPQWYSQPGQTDSFFLNSYIGPDLSTYINTLGIPSSKILIGAADNDGDGGAPSGPTTYFTAYANWNAANPTKKLRGFQWFQTQSDRDLRVAEGGAWDYGLNVVANL